MLVFVGVTMDYLISLSIYTLLATLGMALFLTGVKMSMLPIGEAIGANLPEHNSLAIIALTVFFLSFFVAVAEPNVSVLVELIGSTFQGSLDNTLLIFSIAFGVGLIIIIAVMRIIFGFPIRYLFAAIYSVILVISFIIPSEYLAIAYDAGSVTTGAMIVPVLMGLGIGLASVLQDRSELDGFGLTGFATTGPILSLMLLLGVMFS